jgi:TRAP-type uncharacterized transport system fused permease subunit
VACAVQGFMLGRINAIERTLVFIAGLLFIAPGIYLPAIGLAIMLALLGTKRFGQHAVQRMRELLQWDPSLDRRRHEAGRDDVPR